MNEMGYMLGDRPFIYPILFPAGLICYHVNNHQKTLSDF